jgi:hypothetical protein
LLPEKLFTLVGLLIFSILFILPLLSGFRSLRRMEQALFHLTERRGLSVLVIFLTVIGVRLLLLPWLHVPLPGVHDEFSYLLSGDTFAHGRLTNPSHPMWVSFETMHVNWIPTYSSIYPPAQGLVLALGQLLGHPWIGVLLSNAAMCAAIVWMLQAWVPARWAFLGGVIIAVQLSVATYWINSYWGGAVAASGGALVLGSLRRIQGKAQLRYALLLALGIAILANSRPYEGFLLCIPCAIYFGLWMAGKLKTRTPRPERFRKVFVPLSVSILLLGMFMGYYNWRLTGNALLLPHVLNTSSHVTAPMFLWQHAKPALEFRNAQFEQMYNVWEREYYRTTWQDLRKVTGEKFEIFTGLFFWRAELVLLLFVPFLFRDRKMRLPLVALFLSLTGFFVVVWGEPHYVAPIVGVLALLMIQAMRHLNTVKLQSRPIGAMVLRVMVVILLVETVGRGLSGECDQFGWRCAGLQERAEIVRQLEKSPGKHLVIVRYSKLHNLHVEWVYNGAEIDSAKILWARDIDARQNGKLLAYFKDRKVWLAEPDDPKSTQLKPFPLATGPATP